MARGEALGSRGRPEGKRAGAPSGVGGAGTRAPSLAPPTDPAPSEPRSRAGWAGPGLETGRGGRGRGWEPGGVGGAADLRLFGLGRGILPATSGLATRGSQASPAPRARSGGRWQGPGGMGNVAIFGKHSGHLFRNDQQIITCGQKGAFPNTPPTSHT